MFGNYAVRYDEAKVTFYVLLWKRRGISLELYDDYWRDVHGPVCARLPGQYQYWQWHVGHNLGGFFPEVEGVSYATAPDDQIDGIAELTFRSPEDRQGWFTAASVLMSDEHNIFRKAIGYVTEPGNSRTFCDRMPVGDPNGDTGGAVKFHIMLRQAPGVDTGAFRGYLTEQFAPVAARSDQVLRFRLHLFEPPDTSRPDAAGVSHYEAPEDQYQAAFEIAFRDNFAMERFFASDAYRAVVREQARHVRQVTAFPERYGCTFVYDGRMTLSGQRGSRTAELISRAGSTNQLEDAILDLILGEDVR